ncbi:3-phosphoshikimate 1-carboxyvinyltransferase [Candidatus Woesearchaeota archaeon]|nr:3-phosphoshikimate 1-carboxyvinyltransferase [Candidatus Woesearchaeota archaeon]
MLAIKTKKYVKAVIEAPPSKSYTQRALVIAALANGKSVIKNPLFSDDTCHMISALKAFGARIERKGSSLAVYGTNGKLKQPKGRIFAGNAGTTMRFITAFASLADGASVITGDKRMQQRPINDLLDALRQLGVKSESSSGCPPVKIYGGNFIGGTAKLKGSISSQYLSSILMVAPYAEKDVKISITGNLASKPYVDITIDVMKNFGVDIKNVKYEKFIIKNTKKYKSGDYAVEGDASSASYFFAAAAVTKGRIMVKNINPKSKQGDIKFVDILKRMGCGVRNGNSFIEVQGGSLKGVDVDMNEMPDIVPTLAVTGLFADSATTIRNVPNLRLKETDRLRALAFELRKTGANVEEMQDGLRIKRRRLQKAIIETYNDHRMAMSFAVAGLVINGIRIKNPGCVAKSFPDFWEKFNEMYKR